MRVRTFTVPFSTVVGDDATELEFGPDDRLVVRPLFGLSASEAQEWAIRIVAVEDEGVATLRQEDETAEAYRARSKSEAYKKKLAAAEAEADKLILDLIAATVTEWHLAGPSGDIPMPRTPADLDALPAGLRVSLYPFLKEFRGKDANPTTNG
jgi:hypothetical protein